MPTAPRAVREVYERMKEESDAFISLKKIGKNYYLYKQTGVWDKDKKKTRIITEYLGKIDETGKFIKKLVPMKDELERAQAIIARNGGEVIWNVGKSSVQIGGEIEKAQAHNEGEDELLRILSMNGRASIPLIAKITGMSNAAAEYRVKKIEEKYKIKYLPEIYTSKLGYIDFIIFVKFEGAIPSIEEMRKELSRFPRVQLAIATHGKYDLFIYFVAETEYLPVTYEWLAQEELYKFRSGVFKAYAAKWYASPFFRTYGYVPLRDEFFDVVKDRIWKKSKESPRPAPGQLLSREYAVLKELNEDGQAEFTSIDEKYGFDRGRSDYTYDKLVANGTIKRITMTMQEPPVKYVAIICMDLVQNDAFAASRPELLRNIIEKSTPINKYALVGDINAPYGGIFVLPVEHEGTLEKVEKQIKDMGGTNVYTLLASETIVGSLCYRMYDNMYSSQQRILSLEYEKKEIAKTDYYGPRKAKTQTIRRDIRGVPLDDEYVI